MEMSCGFKTLAVKLNTKAYEYISSLAIVQNNDDVNLVQLGKNMSYPKLRKSSKSTKEKRLDKIQIIS
jgi:hypothetical protein